MTWDVRIAGDPPVLELMFGGVLTREELAAIGRDGLALATEHGSTLILIDCAGLEGGHSASEIYDVAERWHALPQAIGVREAVVQPVRADAAEDVRFWQSLCKARGIDVAVFRDRESALAWLTRSRAAA